MGQKPRYMQSNIMHVTGYSVFFLLWFLCEYIMRLVILDKYIPSILFNPEKIHYIVEPASNPGWWQIATTDSESHPIIDRELLKDENLQIYLDLQDYDELVDSGEIQTQKVFFHKTGFLASFPKKEWATIVAIESRENCNKIIVSAE